MRHFLILGNRNIDRNLFMETVRAPEHTKSDIGIINVPTLLASLDSCYNSTHFKFLLLKL